MVELLLPSFGEVSFTPELISGAPVCNMIGVSTPKQVDCTVTAQGITWIVPEAIPGFSAV
jgi:hypothetical protein